jgi:hypothetical protein
VTCKQTRRTAAALAIVLAGSGGMCASAAGPSHAEPTPAAHERPAEVRVIEQDGFSWADAGIGALAALGLGLAVTGAGVAIRGGSRTRNQWQRGGRT